MKHCTSTRVHRTETGRPWAVGVRSSVMGPDRRREGTRWPAALHKTPRRLCHSSVPPRRAARFEFVIVLLAPAPTTLPAPSPTPGRDPLPPPPLAGARHERRPVNPQYPAADASPPRPRRMRPSRGGRGRRGGAGEHYQQVPAARGQR